VFFYQRYRPAQLLLRRPPGSVRTGSVHRPVILPGIKREIIMNSFLNWISANQQIIYIVILMIFVGIEVIGRVPSVLHTPLMSGANAIHGVVIIGAIIVMGKAETDNYLALVLGFLAVVLGTLNVVGGFVVTDRMLEMFKKKKK
jgi:H+-translocating NAD(P) transhydrogenase subunit alpha